ncbi:Repeat domain-containing protein [Armatimonadetes bacterium DC]|nr:Repeat domain-containing protein [Armatimonadetes bacterium DC]
MLYLIHGEIGMCANRLKQGRVYALRILSGWLVATLATAGWTQMPYRPSPEWRSADRRYATGGVFADLNNDGWLDFVVSNGNDMRRERVAVYYNTNGTLATTPGWESSDVGYHGHLAVGDINADGWLDVVVAVLLPQGGPGVKLYLNQGGTLSPTPSWASAVSFYGWYPALGDPDTDGDLDLAIGGFWPYGSGQTRHYIFFNRNGMLETTPSWQVTGIRDVAHMQFGDIDRDGDLDLVAAAREGNLIFRNQNGIISTTPDWVSTDNNRQFANTLALGDVTGDGFLDLIMSDNNQLTGGSGYYKLYRNLGTGVFESTPHWRYYDGYVSGVALADVNGDGHLDLAAGKWWGNVRLFLNTGTGLSATPIWSSAVQLVVEAICFGDLNRDGLVQATYTASAGQKLHYLGRQPIERILQVRVDGRTLSPAEYCYNLTNGWISLRDSPAQSLTVEYEYSTRLEMGVTDWENRGNIVFYHRQPGDVDGSGCVDDSDLLRVLFAFGQSGSALSEDLNLDGTVDDGDLLRVLFHFGAGC